MKSPMCCLVLGNILYEKGGLKVVNAGMFVFETVIGRNSSTIGSFIVSSLPMLTS
jgi:hypothetical protein